MFIKKRKVITTITSIAILLSLFSVNASVVQAESLSGGQLLKQYIMENSIVEETTVSTELTAEDEASINASYIQNYIESNETAKQSYGGCYIDDNGKLHVLFTENVANSVVNSVNTMTENNTVYETCEYTLDELTALKEYISAIMTAEIADIKLAEIAEDIVAVGVYERQNKVFVEILNCTNEKIAIFKEKISSSDLIVFENTHGYETEDTIKPGSAISTANYLQGRSVGFRCKVLNSSGNYIKGFMTAGHGLEATNDIFYSGIYIGYVQTHVYGGYVDGAFVYITNGGYVMSTTTQHGAKALSNNTYVTGFVEGGTVYKDGFATELTSGKITSTSVSTKNSDGIQVTDCVKTDYDSEGGDSGGVVFVKSDGVYHIAGIHRGSSGNYAYFVKVKRLKEAFEFVLY